MNSAQKGRAGEAAATHHYRRQGYHILARNFTARTGEIDIIAQKGQTLVFAEVKTRGIGSFAAAKEWVNAQKQRRLVAAAQVFIAQNPQLAEHYMRFDVVEVQLDAANNARLHQIENAFIL